MTAMEPMTFDEMMMRELEERAEEQASNQGQGGRAVGSGDKRNMGGTGRMTFNELMKELEAKAEALAERTMPGDHSVPLEPVKCLLHEAGQRGSAIGRLELRATIESKRLELGCKVVANMLGHSAPVVWLEPENRGTLRAICQGALHVVDTMIELVLEGK